MRLLAMKQKIVIITAFILPLFFSSCVLSPSVKGNGNVVEETRKTQPFNQIKVSRGMNVYISQGDETKVTVEADENLLDVIETKVQGDVLTITTDGIIRKAKVKKVYVTTPEITAIKSTAGSNVFSETMLNANEMEISATAGSNIKLDINIGSGEISANAGSNIMLEGKSEKLRCKASSGSNIKAEDLRTKEGSARVSSGANIWISTETALEGEASSGGNIFYYGSPEKTEIHSSSGGNVIKK